MATDPTMDREYVQELREHYFARMRDQNVLLRDRAMTKFVTVLPASGWRELTPDVAAARSNFLRAAMEKRGYLPATEIKANVDTPDDVIRDAWQAMEQQRQATLETAIQLPVIGVDLAKEGYDRTVLMTSGSLGKTSLFNDVMQAATDRIAILEAENAILRVQLAGKVSISCADATAAIRHAPTLVTTIAKPAMPATALAHRKLQIGLRTL